MEDEVFRDLAALSSKVLHIFNQLFFVFTIIFQPIPIGNAVLRRFYLCNILAKRHSLGVTCVFL